MKKWTTERLQAFATADDLRISPFYSDGQTYGTPTWIWSVVVGEHLYVRAWNGQRSSWYHSAIDQRAGRIYLTGRTFQVGFRPVISEAELTTRIDNAYRQKYQDSAYVQPMLQAGPQSATVEILPA
ncbi:hypothetical protein IV54_GL002113 [Levilactobacillus paucivorans]|uniref:DUF2255 domain-containing protein n=1 Tax=Levilactobacillus paucivorans TaxID=616990 RepID=A0A0R2LR53_9LACO|nr:DUF2255 family protein [Levilactobacillus paucivorans]KRO03751.1 hypothetical protein IV54_GL002113 [Levilactobacillus paucivorans]